MAWHAGGVVDALKLREILSARHLSLQDLADRSGVSPRAVTYAASGKHHSSARVLRDLAAALDVRVEDITVSTPARTAS